ncbi:MAG: ribbon-helix-helix protein, CopG family [Nitrospirae bacterium]|nr:ribbon-helix-helix protein, CopG family [Nitrospirota bacterium]
MARAAEKTAKKEARTKSELIREALRQYLWGRRWKALRQYGEQKARELGVREEDVEGLVHETRTAKR